MNKTAESSFAPLEYYKKLTNCLANRKNLKLNISKIQGSRDFRHKSTPFITNRKIQVKFLANYNLRKQFNENQKQQREKLANKQGEAIFKVKDNAALNEKLKRKTNDESYINLPDSYFKANQLPDLSMFKVPEIPPTKRQKIEILPNTVNTSNFTLGSLFSGNFNPPQFSTPIEREKAEQPQLLSMPIEREEANKTVQPQPLIADPNDILGSFGYLQFHEEENHGTDKIKKASTPKELDDMKYYKVLVDESSVYVETACLDDIENPIKITEKKVNNKHEVASQSPRPSLISPRSVHNSPIAFLEPPKEAKKTQSWPVPVFYDQSNQKIVDDFAGISDDDMNPLFENTNKLFSFLDDDDSTDLGMCAIDFDEPRTSQTSIIDFDDEPRTSQSSFFNHTPHPSSNTFLASTSTSLTPYPRSPGYGDCDDLDWLGNKFAKSMDMSWETDSDFTFSTQRNQMNHDISAIFRSPPKSNCLEFKKPFSRTIERPKKYNRSETDECPYKQEEFSWWYSDLDTTDSTFLLSDTQNLFDTKCSMF